MTIIRGVLTLIPLLTSPVDRGLSVAYPLPALEEHTRRTARDDVTVQTCSMWLAGLSGSWLIGCRIRTSEFPMHLGFKPTIASGRQSSTAPTVTDGVIKMAIKDKYISSSRPSATTLSSHGFAYHTIGPPSNFPLPPATSSKPANPHVR